MAFIINFIFIIGFIVILSVVATAGAYVVHLIDRHRQYDNRRCINRYVYRRRRR